MFCAAALPLTNTLHSQQTFASLQQQDRLFASSMSWLIGVHVKNDAFIQLYLSNQAAGTIVQSSILKLAYSFYGSPGRACLCKR